MVSAMDYQPLESSSDKECIDYISASPWNSREPSPKCRATTYVFLAVSLILNLLAALVIFSAQAIQTSDEIDGGATRFAGLVWDTPDQFKSNTQYDSLNETLTELAWESLDYNMGSVALSDKYADSLGLPRARRYPWDDSKGLYFLNGYHSIHCLKILRNTIIQLSSDEAPSSHPGHWKHCLDSLLQDTLCVADDTPRHVPVDPLGLPGIGQTRTCRNWKKLETFARMHWSCWKNTKPTDRSMDDDLRFRYCPPDSPYYEQIHLALANSNDEE